MFEKLFEGFVLEPDRLKAFGFSGQPPIWSQSIADGKFLLTITIQSGKPEVQVRDTETNEPYTLYLTSAHGIYIDQVRDAVLNALEKIRQECTVPAYFQKPQTNMVLDFIRKKYQGMPEFLWEKFPEYAIFRHKDNRKWYGQIMEIPSAKFDLYPEKPVQVLDLHVPIPKSENLLEIPGIYTGWHMNKKNWISILLDGTVPDEKIQQLIEASFEATSR